MSWSTNFRLSKWKNLELEASKQGDLFSFIIYWNQKQDHAGLFFVFGIFCHEIRISFYDSRHWDYETGTWKTYNED